MEQSSAESDSERGEQEGSPRAFRGLTLVFLLSFLSLLGVLFTITALGGLGAWTPWQFVGLFGAVEAASGFANLIAPNVWRLPVVELEERGKVRFAPSVLLLPHWGAAGRVAAGAVLIAVAIYHEGGGLVSLTLVPLVVLLSLLLVEVSALVARLGVAVAELDVLQLTIRWRNRPNELAPVSISASVLQFLLSIATIPAIKLLPPEALYRTEIGLSAWGLAIVFATAVLGGLATLLAWQDRLGVVASHWQQQDAERNA